MPMEQHAFDQPMRQALAGFFLEAAQELRNVFRIFWPLFLYWVVKKSSPEMWVYLLVLGLIFLWIIVAGYLKYRNLTFYIDHAKGEFIFKSGVISKQYVSIRIDRIQQVELSRNILHKILNVYAVEVNTAGTDKAEVKIKAMQLKDAEQLKSILLEKRESIGSHGVSEEKPQEYASIQLSFATIFKIAATSNYGRSLALIIAFFGAAYNALDDFFKVSEFGKKEVTEIMQFKPLFSSIWFIILLLLCVWMLFNIISGVLRFYGYTIQFHDRKFNIHFGLLKTRNTIVYAEKVQVVKMVTNYFQRKMNLSRMFFQQTTPDFHHDKKATIEIPGCTRQERQGLLWRTFLKKPEITKTILPNYRKLLPMVIFYIAIPLAALFIFFDPFPFRGLILIVWVVIVLVLDYFSFKNSKLFIAGDFVLVQKGAWDVSLSMMETYKIQGVVVKQPLWHRKAGLAHITLYTAADNISFKFVSLNEINPYINQWLYTVEREYQEGK